MPPSNLAMGPNTSTPIPSYPNLIYGGNTANTTWETTQSLQNLKASVDQLINLATVTNTNLNGIIEYLRETTIEKESQPHAVYADVMCPECGQHHVVVEDYLCLHCRVKSDHANDISLQKSESQSYKR